MRVVALTAAGASRSAQAWGVRPVTMLQAALVGLVIANVGRIPFLDLGDREAPILINELLVGVLLVVAAAAMARARSLKLNDVSLAALVFVAFGAIVTVAAIPRFGLSVGEVIISLAYLARWCFYFAIYIVVINCVRAHEAGAVWRAAERALLAIAIFGIFQSIFLPNFAFIVYPDARPFLDWDQQRHRLVSTILDPNIAATVIGMGLLVQLARMSSGVRVPLWKPLVMSAAVVMTLSRSGLASLVVASSVIFLTRGLSKRVLRLAAVAVAGIIVALPKLIDFAAQYSRFGVTDASALARVTTWRQAIETFLASPWFGIGFNTYGFVQERRGIERLGVSAYSAEGGLLFIAVLTGVVGLIIYLAMLWFAMRRCRVAWRDIRATADERGVLIGTYSATVLVLVGSVFVNTLLMPFVMELLWVLWGLSFVIAGGIATRPLPRAAG
ncbi:MAG TPA: O-antigen ligase family protein [Gemmatimonadaceae bacterium]|nr:O-antigen ligase family protein [Gemmatimonadaceae bacterium]